MNSSSKLERIRLSGYKIFPTLCLVVSAQCFAQRGQLQVTSLSDPQILKTIFGSEKVDNGVVLWKPNFTEAFEFTVSDDGFCHTNIDTVLYYSADKKDKAVIVFTTHHFDESNQLFGCHFCAPEISAAVFTFDKVMEVWSLETVKKYVAEYGSWGRLGSAALRKIGDEKYALELWAGFTGQGYTSHSTSLYEPVLFENIFNAETHGDNHGTGEPASKMYSWDKTITFAKSPTNDIYYDLILTTKEGKKTSKERYTYNYTFNRYQRAE